MKNIVAAIPKFKNDRNQKSCGATETHNTEMIGSISLNVFYYIHIIILYEHGPTANQWENFVKMYKHIN